MTAVNEEKECQTAGGAFFQLKELMAPGNRKRVLIGNVIFFFMQFAGSNAIKSVSHPTSIETIQS